MSYYQFTPNNQYIITSVTSDDDYVLSSPVLLTQNNPIQQVQNQQLVGQIQVDTPVRYELNLESNFVDSYEAQKKQTLKIQMRVLDYWIHEDMFDSIRKFLIVSPEGVVRMVTSDKEYIENNVDKDSTKDREKKADFIEEHILTLDKTKRIIGKIIVEFGIPWKYLLASSRNEYRVIHEIKKYIKRKLQEMMHPKEIPGTCLIFYIII